MIVQVVALICKAIAARQLITQKQKCLFIYRNTFCQINYSSACSLNRIVLECHSSWKTNMWKRRRNEWMKEKVTVCITAQYCTTFSVSSLATGLWIWQPSMHSSEADPWRSNRLLLGTGRRSVGLHTCHEFPAEMCYERSYCPSVLLLQLRWGLPLKSLAATDNPISE